MLEPDRSFGPSTLGATSLPRRSAILSMGGSTLPLVQAEARKRKAGLPKFIPKPPPISRNPLPHFSFLRCRRRESKLGGKFCEGVISFGGSRSNDPPQRQRKNQRVL